jgi:hypothetical protein
MRRETPKVLIGNPTRRNHLEDLCIDGRIIQMKEIG